jgi:hypothetical protein
VARTLIGDIQGFSFRCFLPNQGYWTWYFLRVTFPFVFAMLAVLPSTVFSRFVHIQDTPIYQLQKVFLKICLSFFTLILFTIFEPLSCVPQIDGSFSMEFNPSQNCFENSWFSLLPFVIFFCLLYVIVIPVSLGIMLSKKWESTHSQHFQSVITPLIAGYDESNRFQFLFASLKKLVFPIIQQVINTGFFAKRLLLCGFFLIQTAGDMYFFPFKSKQVNKLNEM